MSEPTTWEVISYDVWGNEDDGYEVNAAYTTGRVVEIDDFESNDSVMEALRDANEFEPNGAVDIDGDENCMYINMVDTLYPVMELHRTTESSTGRLQ